MARRSRYDPIVPDGGAAIEAKAEPEAASAEAAGGGGGGGAKPPFPIVPFMPWQQSGGQDARGLVEPAKQDLDRKVRAEMEKLEQAFAAKLDDVERQAQEARAEAERLRAETERMRHDPVHALVDQLRQQVMTLR